MFQNERSVWLLGHEFHTHVFSEDGCHRIGFHVKQVIKLYHLGVIFLQHLSLSCQLSAWVLLMFVGWLLNVPVTSKCISGTGPFGETLTQVVETCKHWQEMITGLAWCRICTYVAVITHNMDTIVWHGIFATPIPLPTPSPTNCPWHLALPWLVVYCLGMFQTFSENSSMLLYHIQRFFASK